MSRVTRDEALRDLGIEVRGWQIDQELFDAAVADAAGLNRTNWRCLDLLYTRGPMTAGQLAQAANLTTGAVTAVVDQLEAAGYVRRVRDTVDRRRVIIEARPDLEQRAAPVYGPLIADSERDLQSFTSDQLRTVAAFVRLNRRLLANHTTRIRSLGPGGAASETATSSSGQPVVRTAVASSPPPERRSRA